MRKALFTVMYRLGLNPPRWVLPLGARVVLHRWRCVNGRRFVEVRSFDRPYRTKR